MFRGDTLHSGVFSAAGAKAYAGVRWRYQMDGPVVGTPTVAGNRLFIGSTAGDFVALDRATGQRLWQYQVEHGISSSAAVTGDRVVISGRDGRVVALDPATGRRVWQTEPSAEIAFPWGHESGDVYHSSPVIAAGAVFVGRGDGSVVRLALGSGHLEWRFMTGAPVRSSPAYGDGTVYVGSADGRVYAIDARTGRARWQFETEGAKLNSADFGFDRRTVQSSPALDQTTVYIGARDGILYAIDRATGRERWRFDHHISWVNSSPAIDSGVVYAGSSDAWFVQAVDAATAAERWRAKTGSVVWSSPAIAGSTIYATEANGTVYAFDRATGAERWRSRLGGRTFSSPVVADSTLYYGNEDGGVFALGLTSGAGLVRAVFWDSTVAAEAQFGPHQEIRRYLTSRGYQWVDATALPAWLAEHGSQSSIVFAMDVIPRSVDTVNAAAPLRAYLERGGAVVWLGLPPRIWPFDRKQGGRDLKQVDRAAATRLLGVGFTHGNFDLLGAVVTDAGRRWGLREWSTSNWSADSTGLDVLARDLDGRAAAWVKSFGGPPGTGFVRLLGGRWPDGIGPAGESAVQQAAEYRPLR